MGIALVSAWRMPDHPRQACASLAKAPKKLRRRIVLMALSFHPAMSPANVSEGYERGAPLRRAGGRKYTSVLT